MAGSSADHRFRRPTPPLEFLPEEILREILRRLPVKSLMRFKCVSRLWRSVIADPSFAEAYRGGFRGILISEPIHHRLESTRYLFCLSHSEGPETQIRLHTTMDHGEDWMGQTDVVNGLVCFYDRNVSFLYNIATRERLALPLSRNESQACSYHLGLDTVDKRYKLLKICPVYEDYDDDDMDAYNNAEFLHHLDCEILTIGVDSSWRTIGPPPPLEIITRSVCLDGVIYWMEPINALQSRLVAFSPVEETFRIIPTPEDNSNQYSLPGFGPGLAITLVKTPGGRRVASVLRYGSGAGGELVEGGMWVEELKFNLPVWDEKYEVAPMGILANGNVVVYDNRVMKRYPAPLYVLNKSRRKYDKIMVDVSAETEELISLGSLHVLSYLEENIIPLGSLVSRN